MAEEEFYDDDYIWDSFEDQEYARQDAKDAQEIFDQNSGMFDGNEPSGSTDEGQSYDDDGETRKQQRKEEREAGRQKTREILSEFRQASFFEKIKMIFSAVANAGVNFAVFTGSVIKGVVFGKVDPPFDVDKVVKSYEEKDKLKEAIKEGAKTKEETLSADDPKVEKAQKELNDVKEKVDAATKKMDALENFQDTMNEKDENGERKQNVFASMDVAEQKNVSEILNTVYIGGAVWDKDKFVKMAVQTQVYFDLLGKARLSDGTPTSFAISKENEQYVKDVIEKTLTDKSAASLFKGTDKDKIINETYKFLKHEEYMASFYKKNISVDEIIKNSIVGQPECPEMCKDAIIRKAAAFRHAQLYNEIKDLSDKQKEIEDILGIKDQGSDRDESINREPGPENKDNAEEQATDDKTMGDDMKDSPVKDEDPLIDEKYIENVFKEMETGATSERDELFEDAGNFVTEREAVSAGSLQREFKISYSHAMDIMEQLEDAGVIGEDLGDGKRSVLMSKDEFGAYLTSEAELNKSVDISPELRDEIEKQLNAGVSKDDIYGSLYARYQNDAQDVIEQADAIFAEMECENDSEIISDLESGESVEADSDLENDQVEYSDDDLEL